MPYQPKFDLDLKFGHEGEEWLRTLLGDQYTCQQCGEEQGLKGEVKRERDMWHVTRNLFFEFEWNGKPSGFKATQADWWVHILTLHGQNMGAFLLPVPRLREELRKLVNEKHARVTAGGDQHKARGVLLPLGHLWRLLL